MLTIHPEPTPGIVDIRGGTPARWRAALDALTAAQHPAVTDGDFSGIVAWAPRHLIVSREFAETLIAAGVAKRA